MRRFYPGAASLSRGFAVGYGIWQVAGNPLQTRPIAQLLSLWQYAPTGKFGTVQMPSVHG